MPEQRSSPGSRARRQNSLYLAGSLAVLLAAFYPLLLPGRLLAAGDLPFFHLPLRTLFKSAVESGFPWWNGTLNGGQPILSNPNYAAFYPPSWLTLLLPVPLALHLILLLHVGWAFTGSWTLARHLGCRRPSALLAATAFALGGCLVSTTSILTLFCGFAWLPWILLWGHRVMSERSWLRPVCLLGVGLAAQLLAGEPVACIISGIALLGLAIDGLVCGSRNGLRLAVGVVLAVAIGAVQLVPTAVRLHDSPRGAGEIESSAGLRSMHPTRFTEWAVAHPMGDPNRLDEQLFFGQQLHDKGFPYIVSIYPGLLIAILAIAGLARPGVPLRSAWITMLFVGSALAIGRHNPLYLGGIAHLPVLDQVRYPEKYILAAMAALPFAAALHWERFLAHSGSAKQGGRSLAVLLAGVVSCLVALIAVLFLVVPEAPAWLVASKLDGPLTPERTATVVSWVRTEVFLALAVAGAVWLLLTVGRRLPRPWLAVAAVALLAGDLAWQNRHALEVVPVATVLEPTAALAEVATDDRIFTDLMFTTDGRVSLRSTEAGPDDYWHGIDTAEPYVAALWGYSYALNHDYDLMATRSAQHALAALTADWSNPIRAQRLLGAWNVGSVLLHRPLTDVLRDRYEERLAPRLEATSNPERLPLVRSVPAVSFHADQGQALAAARAHDYQLADHGHWVAAPGDRPPEASRSATDRDEIDASWNDWDDLLVETRGASSVFLQVATTFDPGWRASIDGRDASIHETATGQMGVVVPPGEHRVEIRFRDRSVFLGMILSLMGLLVATALWTRGHESQI